MKPPAPSSPQARPAGVVGELHALLNWLLIAGAYLVYVIFSDLLSLPSAVGIAVESGFTDWPVTFVLCGLLLGCLAAVLTARSLFILIIAMFRLRSGSPPEKVDAVFRKLRLFWRTAFISAVLGGTGYLVSLPAMWGVHEKEMRWEARMQQERREMSEYLEQEKAERIAQEKAERIAQEEAARKQAEYLKGLEDDYYRQKRLLEEREELEAKRRREGAQ